MKIHPSVAKILTETQNLPAEERLKRLQLAAREAVAIKRLEALEGINVNFGNQQTYLNTESPLTDSGDYPWTEVFDAAGGLPAGQSTLTSELDLQRARRTGRSLAAENEFAIGAQRLRRSYIIGNGIKWKVTPKEPDSENEKLTQKANLTIEEFVSHNVWQLMEREICWRVDRDGEAFLRLFVNADGPLTVRFVEPEMVQAPMNRNWTPEEAARNAFGVQVDARNMDVVTGYWIKDFREAQPKLVAAMNPLIPDIPQIIHIKGNVDMKQRRGWPLMWPGRHNLFRAEKLLRNMSVVAALQAAIALIRKHEQATSADVANFLADNEDFNWTNSATGNNTSAKIIEGGLVIDAGPGYTMEAPISSVNASVNVEVLRAELRSVATMINMPEFMFTSQIDGSFAGSLVAEAPFVKYMEGEQLFFGLSLKPILEAHIAHEIFWGRLTAKVQKGYKVKPEFTSLEVRDFLKESQQRQIHSTAGLLSKETWREMEGYDNPTEKRNLEREHEEAMEKAQAEMAAMPQPTAPDGGKQPGPSADDGQNDGKGGKDQSRSRGGNQPNTTFAQKDAQAFTEERVSAIRRISQKVPGLVSTTGLAVKLIDAVTTHGTSSHEKIMSAMSVLIDYDQEISNIISPDLSHDEVAEIAMVLRTQAYTLGKNRESIMAMGVAGILLSPESDPDSRVKDVISFIHSIGRRMTNESGGDAGGEVAPGVPI